MSKVNPAASALIPQIGTDETTKQLSKLQQQFNKKINQINKLKQAMAEREELLAQGRKHMQKELQPLIAQIVAKRVELVYLLDSSYDMSFFRKREKQKLADLIVSISEELIDAYDKEELVDLHDKYAEQARAAITAQDEEEIKDLAQDMLRNMFGVDIEINDLNDFEQIQAQLDKEMEQREQERQQRQKARKTKAQQAKEDKIKAELSNISKASRRVYTELAKQLHPDTEQDEAIKAQKEETMKKVTHAYKQNDFFELLKLQMEFIQTRDKALDSVPEDQLKYYVKILQEQIKELQEEQYSFEYGPDAAFYHRFCGSAKQMNQKFRYAKEDLQLELVQLKQDLRHFTDPQYLRDFLKEIR
ncbi:J domain-containing protein [Pontibacter sp. SGAir0037]|uniref:J domain-containing protein n=1 Tax=Pontibacter sp. SGAir0037 TaxID=2571030 RepID=UPI0010CD289B|nr:J domain-containing protein [Pontibacter sp. SGAir0037]QCR23727.1 J domain-containing protein [Pontibacter sp. SGAir0037]